MNLRTILLSGVALLGLSATFGFKSKKAALGPVSLYMNGKCINIGLGTNEPNCSATGTGPQCTVSGYPFLAYKFEATMTPSCSVPLRTPF